MTNERVVRVEMKTERGVTDYTYAVFVVVAGGGRACVWVHAVAFSSPKAGKERTRIARWQDRVAKAVERASADGPEGVTVARAREIGRELAP